MESADLPDPEELAAAAERVAGEDPDGAGALARQALDLDPASARAANVLGVLAHARGRLIEAQLLLEQACSQATADDDMRANLATVRAELARVYAEAAAAPEPAAAPAAPQSPVRHVHDHSPLGYHPSSDELGRVLAQSSDPALVARLGHIPSATVPGERQFMHTFAAELWSGQDDVFENGPLLGGTTRALALGMLANPARDPGSKLHTYDWFRSDIGLDVPENSWDVLIASGQLSRAAWEDSERTGSFQAAFDELHSGHDYSSLLVSHRAYLPGSPADEETMPDLFEPEPGSTWRLLLVDGCKSWYGTRYFLERVVANVPAGSHLLFQDYGWYSCFWLSAIVGMFQERFRLIAHVATTYAWELTQPIDPAELAERFPDAPQDLGPDGIDALYVEMIERAKRLADPQLTVALTLHHAGALAYIGEADRARSMIEALATRAEAAAFLDIIRNARQSPTYTPEGPIYL